MLDRPGVIADFTAGQAEKAGAACHELARADQIGPDFITHLPMSLR
jgi:hypothetical protein